MSAASVLRLAVEVPGFYVNSAETSEDIEVAMQLITKQITVTFAHTEGDSNQVFLKPMEAHIIGYAVVEEPHWKPDFFIDGKPYEGECIFPDLKVNWADVRAATMVETPFGPWPLERFIGASFMLGSIIAIVVCALAEWLP